MSELKKNQQGFPDSSPEVDRSKAWHKQYLMAIMETELNLFRWSRERQMTENYNYFLGRQSLEKLKYMEMAAGNSTGYSGTGNWGSELSTMLKDGYIMADNGQMAANGENCRPIPARWANYNMIRTKVLRLQGELIKRGFGIQVQAINDEAKVEKLKQKNQYRHEMLMRQPMEQLAMASGIHLGMREQIAPGVAMPASEEELEEFMQYDFKTNSALVMETALNFVTQHYKWEEQRLYCFLDMLVTGESHTKVDIVNGYPRARRIDPRNMVSDRFGQDDFLSDSVFDGEWRYIPLVDAAREYGLSVEDLKALHGKTKNGSDSNSNPSWGGVSIPSSLMEKGSGHNGLAYAPFVSEGGVERVLIFEAQWIDAKYCYAEIVKDDSGNIEMVTDYFDDVPKDIVTLYKKQKNADESNRSVERRAKDIKRRATLIGGELLVEWGEGFNFVSDVDHPYTCRTDYVHCIPHQVDGYGTGLVEELKPLQDDKNKWKWKIKHEVAKAGGSGRAIDVAQIPDSWGVAGNIESVIHMIKGLGIFVYNSAENLGAGDRKPFEQWDLTISQNVATYIQLIHLENQEANDISGVSSIAEGKVTGQNQLAGTTQMSQENSSLVLLPLFTKFYQFEGRIMTKWAAMIKICWALNPERFAPILGEAGMAHLVDEMQIQMDDYAAFVYPYAVDKSFLNNYIMNSISQGGLDAGTGLEILELAQKDYRRAVRRLVRMSAQQQEAAQQQQQQQLEMEAAKADAENEKALAVVQQKTKGDLMKAQIEARSKAALLREKLAAERDMEAEELRVKVMDIMMRSSSSAS
ncbi:MAG: hypothetical protein AB8B69_09075 [Chitinophagales bacterium]